MIPTTTDKTIDVQKIRRNLIISISIQLLFWILIFGYTVYFILHQDGWPKILKNEFFWILFIWVFVFVYGLVVSCRSERYGLLIFAWLTIILCVVMCLVVTYIILVIIALGSAFGSLSQAYIVSLLIFVSFLAIGFLMVTSIRSSLKLAELLNKQNEYGSV